MKLFLDVDGVLAPLPNRSSYWGDWENVGRGGGPTPIAGFGQLWLSRHLGDALSVLTLLYPVEIVWLTTWGDLANEKLSPYFGWPEFLVLKDEYGTSPQGSFSSLQDYYHAMKAWWKIECLRKQTSPFIWVDDDIGLYSHEHPDALNFLGEMEVPPLILAPESSEGLTPNHIDLIRQYLVTHSA